MEKKEWAYVSEYQDHKSLARGKGRRISSSDKTKKFKLVPVMILGVLFILMMSLIVFLWRGSWIIPFLQ